MHELSLAHDLFRIAEEKAKENGLKRINRIVIVVGQASGIEGDFLRHSLEDHLLPGSIASDAIVEIERQTVRGKCRTCGTEFDCDSLNSFHCPYCQGINLEITQGKDVYLKAIEGE